MMVSGEIRLSTMTARQMPVLAQTQTSNCPKGYVAGQLRGIISGANTLAKLGSGLAKTGTVTLMMGIAATPVPFVGEGLDAAGAFLATGGLVFQGVADLARLSAGGLLWAMGDSQPFQAAAYQSFADAVNVRLDVPDLPLGVPDPMDAAEEQFAGADPCP
jgi:hypothetical protein